MDERGVGVLLGERGGEEDDFSDVGVVFDDGEEGDWGGVLAVVEGAFPVVDVVIAKVGDVVVCAVARGGMIVVRAWVGTGTVAVVIGAWGWRGGCGGRRC